EQFDLPRPGDGLEPGRHAAAVDMDLPGLAPVAADPLGVDVHHDALAAESSGRPADELGVAGGRRADRHLVRPGAQQRADILDAADAAAHGQRHEAHLGRPADDVQEDAAVLVAGRDIQEDQLVGPLGVVTGRHVDRIARVPEVHEVRALDDTTVVDVEAGDDPLGQHTQPRPENPAAQATGIDRAASPRPRRAPRTPSGLYFIIAR